MITLVVYRDERGIWNMTTDTAREDVRLVVVDAPRGDDPDTVPLRPTRAYVSGIAEHNKPAVKAAVAVAR